MKHPCVSLKDFAGKIDGGQVLVKLASAAWPAGRARSSSSVARIVATVAASDCSYIRKIVRAKPARRNTFHRAPSPRRDRRRETFDIFVSCHNRGICGARGVIGRKCEDLIGCSANLESSFAPERHLLTPLDNSILQQEPGPRFVGRHEEPRIPPFARHPACRCGMPGRTNPIGSGACTCPGDTGPSSRERVAPAEDSGGRADMTLHSTCKAAIAKRSGFAINSTCTLRGFPSRHHVLKCSQLFSSRL